MWVKLDDGFAEHPKIARVGAVGAWLQVQALCYANRNLTDGFLPRDVAENFARRGVAGLEVDPDVWPAMMVAAGLWEREPDGYRIHDFEQYQPSRDQVQARRAAGAQRVQRHRARARPDDTDPGGGARHAVTDPRNAVSPGPGSRTRKEEDPGPARAREARWTPRARGSDPVPDPATTRRHLATLKAPPPRRSGEPTRLVDMLEAIRAKIEAERERDATTSQNAKA